MQAILAAMAWVASSVSGFSYPAKTLPDIENEDFIKECVQSHQKFRSEVNPPASNMLYMSWDPALARIAKTWAKFCQFEHNPQRSQMKSNFTYVGENIWTGSLSLFSVYSAILSWYNEIQYYDFNTMKCSKIPCGHYTQVVWADSYKVGCAVQFCPKVSGLEFSNVAHFICNYGPGGNFPTWPYKRGATCSACPNDDKCLTNLCVNPQRDNVTRYHSVAYPGWIIYSRNRYSSLIIIAKSVLLLLSFIITLLVKHKYPKLILLD